jgi:hypothetical protein
MVLDYLKSRKVKKMRTAVFTSAHTANGSRSYFCSEREGRSERAHYEFSKGRHSGFPFTKRHGDKTSRRYQLRTIVEWIELSNASQCSWSRYAARASRSSCFKATGVIPPLVMVVLGA